MKTCVRPALLKLSEPRQTPVATLIYKDSFLWFAGKALFLPRFYLLLLCRLPGTQRIS